MTTLGKRWKMKPFSEEHKRKLAESKLAEKNPNWKGDKVGINQLHVWVHQRLPKPDLCVVCEKEPPYDLANITGNYTRDLINWQWLCRRCHQRSDGRTEKLKTLRKGMIPWSKGKHLIPWNKGKKGIYSQETLQKMREARILYHKQKIYDAALKFMFSDQ